MGNDRDQVPDEVQEQRLARYGAGAPVDGSTYHGQPVEIAAPGVATRDQALRLARHYDPFRRNPVDALEPHVRDLAERTGLEVDEEGLAAARAHCEEPVLPGFPPSPARDPSDVTVNARGEVVAARDIAEGETITIPMPIFERIVRRGVTMAGAERMTDEPTYGPGDVRPDGKVMTAPVGGMGGYPVAHGVVQVTLEQATAAEAHGWRRVPNTEADGTVQISR